MATSRLAPLATIVDAEPKGQQLLQFEQGLSPDDRIRLTANYQIGSLAMANLGLGTPAAGDRQLT